VQLASELAACIQEFAAAGPAELRENGARVAPLATLSWEVRGNSEKPLLHMWSENHNLTRRVLAIIDHSEQRLALAVECFGRTKPDRLEFLRTEFERPERELSRDAFAQAIRRLCEHQFPDETLDSITTAADLEHSLSSNYVRGTLRHGKQVWALIAVPEEQSGEDPARCLTFALLWLDRLRRNSGKKQIAGLRILMPADSAAPIAHLLPSLHPGLAIQLFERDAVMEQLQRIEPSALANFLSWIVPARDTQALLDRAARELQMLLPAPRAAISLHADLAAKEVVVRFRGLACMRWHESGIWFGEREPKIKWDVGKSKQVQQLFHELETFRHPLQSDTRHRLYRAQAERWLELLAREDVTRIDSTLQQPFAYTQVFAGTAAEHGILDILSVNKSGRLAILELKTVEHPVFLLQAAKYWLRIRKHLQQGDFQRYGYFGDLMLQQKSPLVYLVAPALHFHPATEALMSYLNPEMEVVRVGLAESWRHGLTVVLRQ